MGGCVFGREDARNNSGLSAKAGKKKRGKMMTSPTNTNVVAGLVREQDMGVIQESLLNTNVVLTHADDVQDAAHMPAAVVLLDADVYLWQAAVDQIRDQKPWARVILVSQRVDARMWAEALNGGAYDMVSRPFHPRELRSVLLGALDARSMSRAA
jgi:DNA-binding NtrC family response regulator